MSEVPQTSPPVDRGTQGRRARLLRTAMLSTGGAGVVAIALFVALWLANPQFPGNYLAPAVAVFVVVTGICLGLERRGSRSWALGLYVGAMIVVIFFVMHFTGGISGPVAVVVTSVPVVMSLVGGVRAARWMALVLAVLYIGMIILEAAGIMVPRAFTGAVVWWAYAGIFVVGLAATMLIVSSFSSLAEESLGTAQQREGQLVEAEQQARQAAQAEREARLQQERASGRLRVVVQRYLAFLERVSAGNYGARLNLDDLEGDVQELRTLGEYLNQTVDALTSALEDMQAVQRRYTSEAWSAFATGGGTELGFSYADGQVAPSEQAWMPVMARAVERGDAVTQGEDMAIPLTVGGEVIGVIAARRDGEWSGDELAVIRAATTQLAQTVETLRLLDQTQRGAVRERAIGQVAERVRQELNVESVLRAAVDEIQQVLGVERVTLRMIDASHTGTEHERA